MLLRPTEFTVLYVKDHFLCTFRNVYGGLMQDNTTLIKDVTQTCPALYYIHKFAWQYLTQPTITMKEVIMESTLTCSRKFKLDNRVPRTEFNYRIPVKSKSSFLSVVGRIAGL